jgi:carbamoyltransferase
VNILGISAFYHDSAAALIRDGEIIAAAQEERFTRVKHDAGFPKNAVSFCLNFSGLGIDDLDAVAFYDKPFLKFERLLETYYAFAPAGLLSFLKAMPVWLKEKIFLKTLISRELRDIEKFSGKKLKLLFPEHHLSHAASAFYPSPFDRAAILTVDGVGEWATASICCGEKNGITILKELYFPHSVGLLYSAFTYYCGFKVNSGEYKLMGLAPYGNPDSSETSRYSGIIKDKLTDIKPDGSIFLNQKYFNYAAGLTMVNKRLWEKTFGFPLRRPQDQLDQHHCDMALAIQKVTEESVEKMAQHAAALTNSDNLCLAGGVALNCVANGRLHSSGKFRDIFIQPAAGDAGGAVGAALAANYIYFGQARKTGGLTDGMKGSFLGPEFSDGDIVRRVARFKAVSERYESFQALAEKTAGLLAQGSVAGWFQGRMEFGPRALGARSILADARNPEMQKTLNMKIKFRENFRPFAPSVLLEDVAEYFELETASPYMLLVKQIKQNLRKQVPRGYNVLPVMEKLRVLRSTLPAITHVDFSARVQTVCRETNERYWALLNEFKKLTGCPVLANTSFNVRGEPIVCTPEEAYCCFMRTEMDILVMGNVLFEKKSQPAWKEKDDWKKKFTPD